MPFVFSYVARLLQPWRWLVVAVAVGLLAGSVLVMEPGVHPFLMEAALFVWGLVLVAFWFDPKFGLPAGKARWQRKLLWPAALFLDVWFGIWIVRIL